MEIEYFPDPNDINTNYWMRMRHKHKWADDTTMPDARLPVTYHQRCKLCGVLQDDLQPWQLFDGDYNFAAGYSAEAPPQEPQAFGDFVNEKMQEAFKQYKPSFFRRLFGTHNDLDLRILMASLANVQHYWRRRYKDRYPNGNR